MLKAAVENFLNNKKNMYVQKKIKTEKASNKKLTSINEEADLRYAMPSWLHKSLKNSRPVSTHPSTFSHPDEKTSPISFLGTFKADGYFRTGNIKGPLKLDVFGNAATDSNVMDFYELCHAVVFEDKTFKELFDIKHNCAKDFCGIFNLNFDDVCRAIEALSYKKSSCLTRSLVKQVYFPIGNGQYHLLSLLTPSGVITKLKSTLDTMYSSDDTKAARKDRKKGLMNAVGFDDVPDITVTKYGGAHPKNVSMLNNQNAGRAYLLLSVPPSIQARNVRLPRYDFFAESLGGLFYKKQGTQKSVMQENMLYLHQMMKDDRKIVKIRTAIHNIVAYGIGLIFAEVEKIRKHPAGWSSTEYYQGLDADQKVLLDNDRAQERENNPEWQGRITRLFARWYLNTYEKTLAKNAIDLGDGELRHIKDIVLEVANEEGLWV